MHRRVRLGFKRIILQIILKVSEVFLVILVSVNAKLYFCILAGAQDHQDFYIMTMYLYISNRVSDLFFFSGNFKV